MQKTIRKFLITIPMLLMLSLGAAPASAHVSIVSTSPASGSSVDNPPGVVTTTFSGKLFDGSTSVTHVGSGERVSKGSGGVDPANDHRIKVSLKSGLKSGKYLVRVRHVCKSGAETSTWRFTLKK